MARLHVLVLFLRLFPSYLSSISVFQPRWRGCGQYSLLGVSGPTSHLLLVCERAHVSSCLQGKCFTHLFYPAPSLGVLTRSRWYQHRTTVLDQVYKMSIKINDVLGDSNNPWLKNIQEQNSLSLLVPWERIRSLTTTKPHRTIILKPLCFRAGHCGVLCLH